MFEVNELAPTKTKPFLKWAGGKSQLIEQMDAYFPVQLKRGEISKYVDPFIGGGAVFFHVAQNYKIKEFFISDVNEEIILAYKTIRKDVAALIERLSAFQNEYLALDAEKQKDKFYDIRIQFNQTRAQINFEHFSSDWIERAAQLIFLNRTCFNGLFRVNSKSEFNVPFGRYKHPIICAADNLRAISSMLQSTKIHYGDFTICESFVDENTFVYFDPPYRPISKTSSFTSYSKYDFDDRAQLYLADFYRQLDRSGAKLMLSNSDPKNEDPSDIFFENAYAGFRIKRVQASRMINCDATKRGKICELLILNY